MKKALSSLILSTIGYWCFGQVQNTNGTTMNIPSGTNLTLSGLNFQNNAGATIIQSGTMNMIGNTTGRDIINNGTFNGSLGTIQMTGITEQQVQGNSIVNTGIFDINNGGQGVSISNTGSLRIHNSLTLTNGRLFTTNASPVRFVNTASNPTENNTSHIVGTAIMESRVVNAGALGTFLHFSMAAGADVGNLELTRRSGDGTATSRGFIPTSGFVVPVGFESIDAHWLANVTNNVDRDITLSWLSAWDNGKDLTQMQLWRTNSPFNIISPWILKTVGVVDMSSRTHTASISLGELQNGWTVSDITNPLPLDLLSFNVKLSENQKDVEITWFAKNEVKLLQYEIERSTDNLFFEKIHTETPKNLTDNSYYFLDKDVNTLGKPIVYYRLVQKELNQTFQKTPSKAVYFRKAFVANVYPNPYQDAFHVKIHNPENHVVTLRLTDNLGRLQFSTLLTGEYIHFQSSRVLSDLPAGSYILEVITLHQTQTFQLIKQ
ncbi:MAG: T9SS type A sorting domain-containing protein [Raineya sp.]|jgi:hypothetical protein|nr:T9SS type A sorting domain-containing protein [Raineya sp.]